MAELVGTKLGHYEVLAVLGRGATGEVYRARDIVLGREVAIKSLPVDLAENPLVVARLDREARLLAALNHPNIATLYSLEHGHPEGLGQRPFLVLELVPGEDLAGRLERGCLPVEEALRTGVQIARALEAAHAKGIVHRDLKPANVVVSPGGTVKVLDFGVAKVIGEVACHDAPGAALPADPAVLAAGFPKLTVAGSLTGTIAYMSPQQLRAEEVNPRADIWAFACVLFECLTGKRAFGRPSLTETFAAILRGEPEWSELPEGTPAAVRRLLERCLQKETAERLQQIESARLTLEHALAAHPRGLPSEPSIAVLPFANQGGEPNQQYFGDGLAEELIDALTRLPGLRVASLSSTFHFSRATDDLREIGEKLRVAAVLSGSVRRADQRLRISARLTNVADGYVVWSERYDRELADVFAVQDEITAAIVAALEPALRRPTPEPRVAATTSSLEAYELYLQGRHCWHQRTPSAVRAGIECFERAARLDPTLARAQTGIADSYSILRAYGVLPWQECRRKARLAVERALELDPTLAEAHLSAGMFELHYDEDWGLAEASFRQAIEINPCSSLAQAYYGLFLAVRARGEEAFTQTEIARDLDPLSPFIHALASLTLLIAHRYDTALQAAARAVNLQADYSLAMAVRGLASCRLGRHAQAIETLERLVSLSRRAPIYLGMLGLAYGRAGRAADATVLAAELAVREQTAYVSPHCDLMIRAGLGDREGIARGLVRCREDRTSALVIAASAGPFLEPLPGEGRREAGEPTLAFGPRASSELRTGAEAPSVSRSRVNPPALASSWSAPVMAPNLAPAPGRILAGKYRLLEEIGRGGMGVVHRAEDTFIHRQVAVKLLTLRDPGKRERLRRRMHREVIITGGLAHPNIVTVHDAGVVDEEMYLVMELVAGENLRQRLARDGALPADQAIDIVLQVLDALAYAHRQGVVHRDLKPENVLVTAAGRVKVADFGIAKLRSLAGAGGEGPSELRDQLTIGCVVGTLGYMAPEQILDRPIDQRADIYALGALLYELLSGRRLSEHVAPLARSEALLAGMPSPPFPPPVADRPLSGVVARALAIRPGDRFASCEELAQALGDASRPTAGNLAPANAVVG